MNRQLVRSKKPQYIYFPNGRICFVLGERADISRDILGEQEVRSLQKLDAIVVEETSDGINYIERERYVFAYSYFGDYSSNGVNNPDLLRLRLDSVYKIPPRSEASASFIPVATFEYNDGALPSKYSFSHDHWGYFNGQSNISPFYDEGNNKSVSQPHAIIATLKSIVYPTKGKTIFNWEVNRYGGVSSFFPSDISKQVALSTDSQISCSTGGGITPYEDPDDISGYSSYSFTSHVSQNVKVSYHLKKLVTTNFQHNKYDKGNVKLIDLTSNKTLIDYSLLSGTFQSLSLTLHEGHSYLVSISNNCSNVSGSIAFNYNSYNPEQDKYNYPVGGLRIASMVNLDLDGKKIGEKRFNYCIPGTDRSSGVLNHEVTKTYGGSTRSVFVEDDVDPNGIGDPHELTGYRMRVITNFLKYSSPVSGVYSNAVTYQNVQVRDIGFDGKDIGYTDYEFEVGTDEFLGDEYPLISNSWQRGQLKRESVFERVDNNYRKVREVENFYSIDGRNQKRIKNFRLIQDAMIEGVINACEDKFFSEFKAPVNYYYWAGWKHLDSTITTDYFTNAALVSQKQFEYENSEYSFPRRTLTKSSAGKLVEIVSAYPLDYLQNKAALKTGNADNNLVMRKMVEKNIIGKPIEIIEKENGVVVKAKFYKYGFTNDYCNVDRIFELNTDNAGIASDVYIPYPDSPELDIDYNSNNGRVIEMMGKDGIALSVIWGYGNQYIIARFHNMEYNDIMGNQILIDNLNRLNDFRAISISNRAELTSVNKKIRDILPLGKQVTTYTYDPLVGMTSKTDPNGITSYYEYDSFGRLIYIRDNDYKILKRFDYHYSN